MSVNLQTSRLLLSPLELKDAPFVYELMNTEGWLKYIGDRKITNHAAAEKYLREGALASYVLNGYGLLKVVLKESGEPIGQCGLLKRAYLDQPDLGFAFLPAYTGYGYAQEAAKAVVEHAFRVMLLPQLYAFTDPANQSSIKLLQKLGFQQQESIVVEGETLSLFLAKPIVQTQP